ncbi:alginate export family protein [Pseudomonas segetis]|uniref:Alginate export n=1 Tax=Pseudomonas segetis TaxID=298908 RepID=A0A239HPP3_9PSED|nr:alginate export family protein [Pseudomonas segetis]SNS82234.1 Alginate export [Pseudomonas segetis]
MRPNLAISLSVLFAVQPLAVAFAQTSSLPSLSEQLELSRPTRPGPPRWIEDYRFLDDESKRSDWYDSLRYNRISESAWLQTGGDLRYRYDVNKQPFFGLRNLEDDSYLQQRAMLHGDVHLFNDAIRTFVQLANTRSWGKDLYAPTDQSRTEIQQAFVDGNLQTEQGRLTARIGRQEVYYGNTVFVTVRETPNIRRSFDGLKLSWAGRDGRKLDAFALRPVRLDADASFNDGTDNNQKFYGLYGTTPVTSALNIDLYAFGLETESRKIADLIGAEDRYTLGTRLFGSAGGFDWTWDIAGQFGEMEGSDIRAWGVSSNTGYRFSDVWNSRLGFKLDIASGDKSSGDGKLETFDPLYPTNGWYGEIGLTTLSNLVLLGPVFAFSPTQDIRLEPGVFAIWRQSTDDAVYTPGMIPVPGTQNSDERYSGTIYRVNLRWNLTQNLTVDGDYNYYDVGSGIRDVGGVDSQFLSVRTTFRF